MYKLFSKINYFLLNYKCLVILSKKRIKKKKLFRKLEQ